MSAFGDVRADLAGKLLAAGVGEVTTNPASNVPFVLVDLARSAASTFGGIGGWPASIPVKIVAAPPGDDVAAEWLEGRLELVLRTLGPAPFDPGTYTTGAGKDCPAYTVTYPVDVPNPDC